MIRVVRMHRCPYPVWQVWRSDKHVAGFVHEPTGDMVAWALKLAHQKGGLLFVDKKGRFNSRETIDFKKRGNQYGRGGRKRVSKL